MENEPNEETSKSGLPRGIYLLPNLFTTAALFSAFYAIIAAMKGYFDIAAIAIICAGVADTLDGRVARLTNTQTAFGAEYDSLSDMVAFGLAPALLVYTWALSELGKLGWLVAFLFTAATALRLARFNTLSQNEDKRYFQGIPCPAAAGVISSGVWMGFVNDIVITPQVAITIAIITMLIAGLMVSTIRFYSFKQIDLKGKVPFFAVLIPVVVLVAVAMDPPEVLFAISLVYAISGPVLTGWRLWRVRKRKE